MKKIRIMIFLLIINFLSFSCSSSTSIAGLYTKTEHIGNFITRPFWRITGQPTFVWGEYLSINQDGSFIKKSYTSCLSDELVGSWRLKGDTLLLAGYDSAYHSQVKEKYLVVRRELRPLSPFGTILKKK